VPLLLLRWLKLVHAASPAQWFPAVTERAEDHPLRIRRRNAQVRELFRRDGALDSNLRSHLLARTG